MPRKPQASGGITGERIAPPKRRKGPLIVEHRSQHGTGQIVRADVARRLIDQCEADTTVARIIITIEHA